MPEKAGAISLDRREREREREEDNRDKRWKEKKR